MESNVINMTPHDVNIVGENGELVRTYPRSGNQIRLKVSVEKGLPLPDGTPTSKTVFGEPEGLPEKKDGTIYIVSQLVKNALPERNDLVVPAEVVRDETGRILGCRSLGW